MATVTTCPKCGEKLRLPDDLRGQRVRCPRCTNVFAATDSASAPPPASTPRPAAVDVPLNLSLDDPDPAPRAAADAAPRSKPVGAVEINLSLDDDAPKSAPPAPGRATEPTPAAPLPANKPPSRRADRNGDRERDDDERVGCPVCGKQNDRDARRCYHCGERLADGPRSRYPDRDRYDNDRPLRRRDTEPHRGGIVLAMGIISLVGLFVIPAVPVVFGIIGWFMGQVDLRKIRNNQMDPDGEGMTRAGWICSIIGTFLNGAYLLLCCGFFGLAMSGAMNGPGGPRTTRSWAPMTVPTKSINKDFNPPPPVDPWKDFKDFPKDK